jgi:O-antigen/teichoic acid export membrane protein
MSRSKHVISGLLSSYAAIGVNILYTLASVPLALHYLDKDEFGFWALVTQLAGYLMLMEFGMTGAVARSLSDHKDHFEGGVYGSILRTGSRVFAIQGGLVAISGIALAWFAAPLLGIPSSMWGLFTILMAAQAVLSGIRLSVTSLGSPLWCHQRLDLSNLATILSLTVAFFVLWFGFYMGLHLYSMLISTAIGSGVSLAVSYLACRRLGLYPANQYKGQFDPKIFCELFHFSKGLFLMNLGAQLTSASQVIIISRILGMEAAATWAISTKVFTMAQQFVTRIFDSSAGGLAEMIVRGECTRLKKRFRDLVAMTAVVASAVASGIALMNGSFVEVWTSGKVTWSPWNNYLLACVLFVTTITRCHVGLSGIAKQISGIKYVYLIEGIAFVSVSLLIVPRLGFIGLLAAALLCNIGITGTYGVYRTSAFFGIPRLEVVGWVARSAVFIILMMGFFSFSLFPSFSALDSTLKLYLEACAFVIIALPFAWFIAMNKELRTEVKILVFRIFQQALSKSKSI